MEMVLYAVVREIPLESILPTLLLEVAASRQGKSIKFTEWAPLAKVIIFVHANLSRRCPILPKRFVVVVPVELFVKKWCRCTEGNWMAVVWGKKKGRRARRRCGLYLCPFSNSGRFSNARKGVDYRRTYSHRRPPGPPMPHKKIRAGKCPVCSLEIHRARRLRHAVGGWRSKPDSLFPLRKKGNLTYFRH